MAQSAITVTVPSPTPPTNMRFLGTTPPTSPSQLVDTVANPAGTLTVFAAKQASADNANFPSIDHEGKGTETVVVAPGSRVEAPTVSFSDLGNYTTNPNRDHASSMSPTTNPTLTAALQAPTTSGTGTATLTCTGTGFTPGCRIWVNNAEQTTTYVSATSLTSVIQKKREPGTWLVDVKLGGVPVASQKTITWT